MGHLDYPVAAQARTFSTRSAERFVRSPPKTGVNKFLQQLNGSFISRERPPVRLRAERTILVHGSKPVLFAGSSPITRPLLLQKHIQSKVFPSTGIARFSRLCHEASSQPLSQLQCSLPTRSNQHLPGRVLPPLLIRAVGAHYEIGFSFFPAWTE